MFLILSTLWTHCQKRLLKQGLDIYFGLQRPRAAKVNGKYFRIAAAQCSLLIHRIVLVYDILFSFLIMVFECCYG